jgi:hypothetical protein
MWVEGVRGWREKNLACPEPVEGAAVWVVSRLPCIAFAFAFERTRRLASEFKKSPAVS